MYISSTFLVAKPLEWFLFRPLMNLILNLAAKESGAAGEVAERGKAVTSKPKQSRKVQKKALTDDVKTNKSSKV